MGVKMEILNILNLTKTYHNIKGEVKALDDLNFNLNKGEFISIVGPSGCGKSTILSILSGIEKDFGGKVIKLATTGYMLQQDALFEWKNVYDNCLIGLEINNNLNEDTKNYVINLLDKYGLKDFKMYYPNNLSGGMRQRVALIRTLATKPDIILLDEPFSALDYQSRLKVSEDVFSILKKEDKSAIIVTHDIAEAITLSDRVIILSKRPAKIKKIMNINWDKKLSLKEKRNDPKFSIYYESIWKEIDENE